VPNRLLRVAVVGTLATVSACQIGTDVSKVATLDVRADADPDTVAIGDSTLLTVTATNPTRDTVRFQTGGCDPLGIEIRTVDGEVIVPAAVGCDAGGEGVLVPPAGTIRSSVVWRGERWIGVGSEPPQPLRPGIYRVRGFVNANGSIRFGPPIPVWLTSP
jgi:hypothetical protein